MTAYVLVGGAWLGAWCWQRIARRLLDNGHDAYPLTLTGLGERAHLASPQVDLDIDAGVATGLYVNVVRADLTNLLRAQNVPSANSLQEA